MGQSEKKEHERKILEDALAASRRRGGEGRRNADRLMGSYLERLRENESPDFVVRKISKMPKRGDCLIGIEHFRVDHFCEVNAKNGHMDSVSAREQHQISQLQQSWHPDGGEEIPSIVVEGIGSIIGKVLEGRRNAFFGSFVTSFSQGLEKHLGKIDYYRENVASLAAVGESIELAFLVEVHVDFSNLSFNSGDCVVPVREGVMPLFSEIVALLKRAAKHVDYLIMCFCPALTDEVTDCWIFRSASLKKSIQRHKVPIAKYCGENKWIPSNRGIRLTPHLHANEGAFSFSYDERGQGLDAEAKLALCLEDLPSALDAKRQNHSFVATTTMQFILDLIGDVMLKVGYRRRITVDDIAGYLHLVPEEELRRRIAAFEKCHFPNSPSILDK